ncbi:MAG: tRNA epoxyqueuosine(34) reductase QueG [Calditrichaeota bacterium]|nr:MAG: tRNA epoxyqueuosine(34) reductase QueG [Calditrichota bacterium]
MNPFELTRIIKEKARALGFDKVGVAGAGPLPKADFLKEWLSRGHHGQMTWMENYVEKRMDVRKLYPQARSVVAVAMNYYTPFEHNPAPDSAKISRYAWGRDYHRIMKKKLKHLLREIRELDPELDGRLFVDTAPIQDKLWAEQAGIGWQGKNTNIISREYGSWLFLGELVLNRELVYDRPIRDFCGSCTACIDACPTDALTPYRLAAEKCLSYITIEMWDRPIPASIQSRMEGWVFGCDICQDVCPWNRFQKPSEEPAYYPENANHHTTVKELEALTEETYKTRFKKSPVYRAGYKNFMRNVRALKKEGALSPEHDRDRK